MSTAPAIIGGICYRGAVVEFTDRESMEAYQEHLDAIEQQRRDRAARLRAQRRDRDFWRAFFQVLQGRRA